MSFVELIARAGKSKLEEEITPNPDPDLQAVWEDYQDWVCGKWLHTKKMREELSPILSTTPAMTTPYQSLSVWQQALMPVGLLGLLFLPLTIFLLRKRIRHAWTITASTVPTARPSSIERVRSFVAIAGMKRSSLEQSAKGIVTVGSTPALIASLEGIEIPKAGNALQIIPMEEPVSL